LRAVAPLGAADHRLFRATRSCSTGLVRGEPAGRACGGVESVVPCSEENVVAFEVQGAGEVDGVVAAEGVLGGEVPGLAG
jgi:hypothetical protein